MFYRTFDERFEQFIKNATSSAYKKEAFRFEVIFISVKKTKLLALNALLLTSAVENIGKK